MSMKPPTLDYVQQRIQEFDEGYGADERAVELVFKQWPSNTEYPKVLLKTIVVNRLYATRILDVRTVASHIVESKIDDRLHRGDASIVEEIALVKFKEKGKRFLSFATKYCSWHEPESYQTFDSSVEQLLWKYQRHFSFATFCKAELRKYDSFVPVIDQLRSHFGLTGIGRKQLDKFLWIEARSRPRETIQRRLATGML